MIVSRWEWRFLEVLRSVSKMTKFWYLGLIAMIYVIKWGFVLLFDVGSAFWDWNELFKITITFLVFAVDFSKDQDQGRNFLMIEVRLFWLGWFFWSKGNFLIASVTFSKSRSQRDFYQDRTFLFFSAPFLSFSSTLFKINTLKIVVTF